MIKDYWCADTEKCKCDDSMYIRGTVSRARWLSKAWLGGF